MADNAPQAFSYASPAIQSIFKDPDTFMSMVRAGYQPVYRPQEVEFRDLVPVEGRWTQRVLVVGPDGVPVVAQYVMEKQPDGSLADRRLRVRAVDRAHDLRLRLGAPPVAPMPA